MTSMIKSAEDLEIRTETEKKALEELRALIDQSGDPLLINNKVENTDFHLLIFLRCRKYDAVSAFNKIQRTMYARKIKYPEIFATLYPSLYYKAYDTKGGGVLKHRDAFGRHIGYVKASAWDTNVLSAEDAIKAGILIGAEILHCEETQLNGVVGIVDTRGFGWRMARQAHPLLIIKYLDLYLHANPVKVKAVHICNASRLFNVTAEFVKKFLPEKLKKRIHMHGGNLSTLHKFISPDILPDIFGGNLTEEEAIDDDFRLNLYTQEREDYYKAFITNCANL